MEGIILMIIFAVLGSLFSNKNKNKNDKQMPPFNNKPNSLPMEFDDFNDKRFEEKKKPIPTAMSLEDFARDIFDQLNHKNEPQKTNGRTIQTFEQPKIQQVQPESRDLVTPTPNVRESRPNLDVTRSARGKETELIQMKKDPIKQTEIGSFVPKTRRALVQAIITSEIIGPPKAKQR
ncbi:hypothetical protein MTP04_24000 [Lysinibacillus sp. PLM2]|nr:hypothetical protein MTP04_24000 [Lysinibacillus sp. PLM2]